MPMAAKVKGGIEEKKWKQMSDTSLQRILLGAELLRCLDDITTTSTRPSRARAGAAEARADCGKRRRGHGRGVSVSDAAARRE